jgi:hypothetical protein
MSEDTKWTIKFFTIYFEFMLCLIMIWLGVLIPELCVLFIFGVCFFSFLFIYHLVKINEGI